MKRPQQRQMSAASCVGRAGQQLLYLVGSGVCCLAELCYLPPVQLVNRLCAIAAASIQQFDLQSLKPQRDDANYGH
jgi:hypothetical protein